MYKETHNATNFLVEDICNSKKRKTMENYIMYRQQVILWSACIKRCGELIPQFQSAELGFTLMS